MIQTVCSLSSNAARAHRFFWWSECTGALQVPVPGSAREPSRTSVGRVIHLSLPSRDGLTFPVYPLRESSLPKRRDSSLNPGIPKERRLEEALGMGVITKAGAMKAVVMSSDAIGIHVPTVPVGMFSFVPWCPETTIFRPVFPIDHARPASLVPDLGALHSEEGDLIFENLHTLRDLRWVPKFPKELNLTSRLPLSDVVSGWRTWARVAAFFGSGIVAANRNNERYTRRAITNTSRSVEGAVENRGWTTLE